VGATYKDDAWPSDYNAGLAIRRSDTDDCDNPKSWTGTLYTGDVDWSVFGMDDKTFCNISGNITFNTGSVYPVKACIYFYSKKSCSSTRVKVNSSTWNAGCTDTYMGSGYRGCCITGYSPKFNINDIDAECSIDDSVWIYTRLESSGWAANTCLQYTISHIF